MLALLRQADLEQSEPIAYQDFEKLMKGQYLGRTFDELVDRAFQVFDVDNRGHISLKGFSQHDTHRISQSIEN